MLDWSRLAAQQAQDLRWLDVAVAVLLAASLFVLLWALRATARRRHAALLATPRREVLELPTLLASRTTTPYLVVLALFAGVETFDLAAPLAALVRRVAMVATFWQAGLWGSLAAMAWLDRREFGRGHGRAKASSIGILRFGVQAVVWSMVVLLTLENLGADITALVAGLGIGGVAVALALQNVLGDLLASLSITLDEPFVVGDAVASGPIQGTVDYIGIKSTRLRSLEGEQIVMPNSELLKNPLRNFGRMAERRVVFSFGVAYETARAALERVPALIREIVESHDDVRFDRSHLVAFDDSALRFETVYFVTTPDHARHMDLQQSIFLAVLEAVAGLGVEFAYPTRSVLLREPAGAERGA